MLRDEGRDGQRARDGGQEEVGKREKMKGGADRGGRGGLQGQMIGKGKKERVRGVVVQETTYKLIGNGLRG